MEDSSEVQLKTPNTHLQAPFCTHFRSLSFLSVFLLSFLPFAITLAHTRAYALRTQLVQKWRVGGVLAFYYRCSSLNTTAVTTRTQVFKIEFVCSFSSFL
mmetsp:Transcript_12381/g.33167  ORF Transcript_12381/g.33167 Transcript_12381/m.33167 type:complete len:100 (+) Transcript_12381:1694-1993(+)